MLSMATLILVSWGYLTLDRHREIHDFFKNPNDLDWAKAYLDQKVNFCNESQWEDTVVRRDQGTEEYFSPSGRYEIRLNRKVGDKPSFTMIDRKDNRVLANVGIPFIYAYSKWVKNERFLIFEYPAARDDWLGPDVFISDTSTGKVIFFGKSAYYDCALEG